jgi:hypothetical protein
MTSERNLRRAFIVFHLTLAIVIFIESVMTVMHSLHSPVDSHLDIILPWFAGLEALAAVLLIIPWTLKIGGWILLVIFAVAIIVHGPLYQMPLFAYAAGVILIMVHGSAYSKTTELDSGEKNSDNITR